jgi:hypothetical protein
LAENPGSQLAGVLFAAAGLRVGGAQVARASHNTVHFSTLTAFSILTGGNGLFVRRRSGKMNRNILCLIIGALAVATAVLGYQFYQDRQKTTGIELTVGGSGISIEKK